MAIVEQNHTYTPEDLRQLPDFERFELVDGQPVETGMGALACWIASLINAKLTVFVLEHSLGMVLSSETQYQCFPDDARRIRKPDVSFIHRSRVTPAILQGFVRIPPDLAVEIVSEHDTYYEVETKVREYLRAGVRLVWVLNPPTRSVRIHRLNGTQEVLEAGDTLSGEEVVAGFSLEVAILFAPPPSDVPLS
jgi:Uma2 family endonuclease